MGVTYKLKDEVVHFIISQRQGNPLFSCRQLAESASEKFGLHLSKSSVHDVLKESGFVTPRGRKPKDKFEIPQEKKKQIQNSLSQVKLLSAPIIPDTKLITPPVSTEPNIVILSEEKDFKETINSSPLPQNDETVNTEENGFENSSEYEGAGKIFFKAALWDLGIFSEEGIRETDWMYYLTYSKGIKVVLENSQSFFIDLVLPLERCIKETVDGLISNIKPLIVDKISNQELFKASMEDQIGFKIKNVAVVDNKDHNVLEITDIVEQRRIYCVEKRLFVVSYDRKCKERANSLFFTQNIENNDFIEEILNFSGFDSVNKDEFIVNLFIQNTYSNKAMLQEAMERLNRMFLRDEQGRLLTVRIQG